MQLDSHVQQIQQELAAAAARGDEQAAELARRMGEALAATLHLHLLDLLGEAALEIGGQLESGRVEVRLAGREPELVVITDEVPDAGHVGAGEELSGRITLATPGVVEGRRRGRGRPRGDLHQRMARADASGDRSTTGPRREAVTECRATPKAERSGRCS